MRDSVFRDAVIVLLMLIVAFIFMDGVANLYQQKRIACHSTTTTVADRKALSC